MGYRNSYSNKADKGDARTWRERGIKLVNLLDDALVASRKRRRGTEDTERQDRETETEGRAMTTGQARR